MKKNKLLEKAKTELSGIFPKKFREPGGSTEFPKLNFRQIDQKVHEL